MFEAAFKLSAKGAFACFFATKASATLRFPTYQLVTPNGFLVSAVTTDKPRRFIGRADVRKAQRDQSSKTQTSDISVNRHGNLSRRWLGLEAARRFSDEPFRHYSTGVRP
jgi:hypothetical protein